ncbi:MAG: metal-dependent hydrolase [Candidatus Dependentiae bacterium]
MPGYKGHLMGGAAAFGATFALVSIVNIMPKQDPFIIASCFVAVMAGSLFPDIDVKSKGQNVFYWLILGLFVYFFYKKQFVTLAYVAIVATLPMLVKHRGLFHNIWFIVGALGTLCYLLTGYLPHYDKTIILHTIFFIAGAVSHLWLDLGFVRMFRFR